MNVHKGMGIYIKKKKTDLFTFKSLTGNGVSQVENIWCELVSHWDNELIDVLN